MKTSYNYFSWAQSKDSLLTAASPDVAACCFTFRDRIGTVLDDSLKLGRAVFLQRGHLLVSGQRVQHEDARVGFSAINCDR